MTLIQISNDVNHTLSWNAKNIFAENMLLSHASEYAVRAVILLMLRRKNNKRLGVKEISRLTGATEPYMAKALQQLVRAGIIDSVKGPRGGFSLIKPDITLWDVRLATNGNEDMKRCMMGFPSCSDSLPCPLHRHYVAIRQSIVENLSSITIAQLAKAVERGEVQLRKG
jgi:Rrf2 family iron-sulfur cluster assembly transcriptional regulator